MYANLSPQDFPANSAVSSSTLPEFNPTEHLLSGNSVPAVVVTGLTTVTSSSRTSNLTIYIMPGGILQINGNISLTTGHLSLICKGSFLLGTGMLKVSAGSILDLSEAYQIVTSGVSTISLGKRAMLKLGNSPIVAALSTKIIGDESVLQAPPVQIFGDKVEVGGTWAIDRAYPQWFTSAPLYGTVDDAEKVSSFIDWAPAINKAIDMKNTGEVSLPRGVYPILSTIRLHYGIRLIGSGATSNVDWEHILNKENAILNVSGTILYIPSTTLSFNSAPGSPGWDCTAGKRLYEERDPDNPDKVFHYGVMEPYVMTVNFKNLSELSGTKESDLLFNYPGQPVVVEHLLFRVANEYLDGTLKDTNINGIYLHGSVELRHLSFYGLSTAISCDQRYSDRRSFHDIYYARAWENTHIIKNENTARFAFFLPGNGDGLVMEGCAIETYSKTSGLYLQKCNGGSLNNNIFNAQVVIDNCYNIVYSGNHMEYGAQLVVKNSSVAAEANYFEKGEMPSVRMIGSESHDKTILNLSNSQFIMYDGAHYYDETHEVTYNSEGKRIVKDKYMSEAFKARVKSMSQYDIQIDENSILTLNSNFRNTLLWGFLNKINYTKNYTYGLLIKASTESSQANLDTEFNLRSGYLTPSCQIANYKVIAHGATIPAEAPLGASIYWWNITAQVPWVGSRILITKEDPEKDFYYKYCYLPEGMRYDKERDNLTEIALYKIVTDDSGGIGTLLRPSPANGGFYIQAMCSSTSTRGNLYLQQIINGTIMEVYIPLCFTRMLFDNGVTLSSFKWEEVK